ncbi:hypothetical protein Bpfe_015119, partial [Biomphalaria pfeifferi]
PYHPYLDKVYNSFINSAANLMASWTQLSPVQFQQLSLTYDDINDVYMSVTALGKVPPIGNYTFTSLRVVYFKNQNVVLLSIKLINHSKR